jgi:hypothetical protein
MASLQCRQDSNRDLLRCRDKGRPASFLVSIRRGKLNSDADTRKMRAAEMLAIAVLAKPYDSQEHPPAPL